ncbi:MAG: hypothetical protein IPM82_30215 [Saprospiraceae bacterium]|nr:hypothetical protein [Saprospiraceae bacterium]
MTKTRDLAIKRLKKALHDDSKKHLFTFDIRVDGTQDIYVNFNNGASVNIGYEKEKNIVPNCAMLMAEHYFELFNFAYNKNPSHLDFWIFDFLLYSEKFCWTRSRSSILDV